MLADNLIRYGLGITLLSGFLGLAACGQEPEVAEEDPYAGFGTDEPVADVADEGVEPEPEVPVEVAEASPPEPASSDMATDGAADGAADGAPIPNHDAADVGEDLFQRGYPLDAMAIWEANAEAGDSYAAYRLGIEYFDAMHVERNIELSLRYQTLAAELGNAAAMFELGSFLEEGLGVRSDINQAAGWYLASAQRGFGPAQHNVATMFEDGAGQPQDLVQAYLYYSLAEGQGFSMNFEPVHRVEDLQGTSFEGSVARLQSMMSEDQLVEAQALIDSFAPID